VQLMNRHDVTTIILGLSIIANGFGDLMGAKEIKALYKRSDSATTDMGFSCGDFDSYKSKNNKTWKAQDRFNKAVTNDLRKLHSLRSPNFTIESKDD